MTIEAVCLASWPAESGANPGGIVAGGAAGGTAGGPPTDIYSTCLNGLTVTLS